MGEAPIPDIDKTTFHIADAILSAEAIEKSRMSAVRVARGYIAASVAVIERFAGPEVACRVLWTEKAEISARVQLVDRFQDVQRVLDDALPATEKISGVVWFGFLVCVLFAAYAGFVVGRSVPDLGAIF